MQKYIDSEKLIAEIQRREIILDKYKDSFEEAACCKQELVWMKDFILSLQQEQPKVDVEKVWDWIDKTFTETEIDSRYGESRNVVMSGFDVCKSDLREKYERDFGLNTRKEE